MIKKYGKLVWAVPMTWVLIAITVVFASDNAFLFPKLVVLGNTPTIEISVKGPAHVFYVGSLGSIEEKYESLYSQIGCKVFDKAGKEIRLKRQHRFFMTRKASYTDKPVEETANCGSVFQLPEDLHYPFEGQLVSSMGGFDGCFWAQSSGSFFPLAALCFVYLCASIACLYYFFFKRSRSTVPPPIRI